MNFKDFAIRFDATVLVNTDIMTGDKKFRFQTNDGSFSFQKSIPLSIQMQYFGNGLEHLVVDSVVPIFEEHEAEMIRKKILEEANG